MGADKVQAWMTANGVRAIRRIPTPERGPDTCEYGVDLRCGGPGGYDTTIAKALARARDANRDWLEWAA